MKKNEDEDRNQQKLVEKYKCTLIVNCVIIQKFKYAFIIVNLSSFKNDTRKNNMEGWKGAF